MKSYTEVKISKTTYQIERVDSGYDDKAFVIRKLNAKKSKTLFQSQGEWFLVSSRRGAPHFVEPEFIEETELNDSDLV